MLTPDGIYASGINRNILECKDRQPIHCPQGIKSINRNILECKVTIGILDSSASIVLIETYWNVKTDPVVITGDIRAGINRNILECKDGWFVSWYILLLRINRNILECKCEWAS